MLKRHRTYEGSGTGMTKRDDSSALIAIALLGLETGEPRENVVRVLGNDVIVNEAGICCVTAQAAREFIEAHHAAQRQAAQRAAAEIADARQQPNPQRERVRQLQASQRNLTPATGIAVLDLQRAGVNW